MTSYTFSTIRFVPRAARDEAVNLGILLYDQDTKLLYRRITDNWAEVRRRTGSTKLPKMNDVVGADPIKVDDDYLDSLGRNSVIGNLFVTMPRSLTLDGAPREALDWVFKSQISVPDLGAGREGATRASTSLAKIIERERFPNGCYVPNYKFSDTVVPIHFPNVFVKDGRPHASVFAGSFALTNPLARIKQRLCEILSLRKWTKYNMDFTMFAVWGTGRKDAHDRWTRDGIELLEAHNVNVVDRDGIGDVLANIRRIVAPSSARPARA